MTEIHELHIHSEFEKVIKARDKWQMTLEPLELTPPEDKFAAPRIDFRLFYGKDGTVVLEINTPDLPEDEDGPILRVWLNHETIWENPHIPINAMGSDYTTVILKDHRYDEALAMGLMAFEFVLVVDDKPYTGVEFLHISPEDAVVIAGEIGEVVDVFEGKINWED